MYFCVMIKGKKILVASNIALAQTTCPSYTSADYIEYQNKKRIKDYVLENGVPKRNSLCICNSNIKFKKCCSKFLAND